MNIELLIMSCVTAAGYMLAHHFYEELKAARRQLEEQRDLMERMVRISGDKVLFARAVQDQAES